MSKNPFSINWDKLKNVVDDAARDLFNEIVPPKHNENSYSNAKEEVVYQIVFKDLATDGGIRYHIFATEELAEKYFLKKLGTSDKAKVIRRNCIVYDLNGVTRRVIVDDIDYIWADEDAEEVNRKHAEETKKSALAKLSPEERKSLGL